MDIEIWKSLDFIGYPNYQISNWGQVKSLNYRHTGKERLLKQGKKKNGYLFVGLSKNNKRKYFYVHKLVVLAFIPNDNPIDKNEINHLDENKENNHVDNLCWCNRYENNNYGTRNERVSKAHKGKPKSEEQKQRISEAMKKTILQFTKDMTFIKEWDSAKSASLELGIDNSSITKCCKHKLKTSKGFIWRYK